MKQLFIFVIFLCAVFYAQGQGTLSPLLRREVFDFAIGDVMQYEYYTKDYTVGGGERYTYSQVTTLDKTVVGDTIIYYNEVKEKNFLGDIYTNYISEIIPYKDSSIFYRLPNYVSDSLKVKYKYIEQNRIYDNAYKLYGGDSIMCQNSVSPTKPDSEKWLSYFRQYKRGIGQVYQYYNDYAHPINWQGKIYKTQLIYYKKGNKTYGKPVDFTTALEEKQQKTNVSIFPNPASNVLFIRQLEVDLLYKLHDINSKTVKQGDITPNTNSIDITNIPKGVYFIQLFNQKNKLPLFQQKIIFY